MSQWLLSPGAGLAAITLQLAYNNSGAPPHITLSAANGGFTLRQGTVAAGTPLFDVQDNAPSSLFTVSTVETVATPRFRAVSTAGSEIDARLGIVDLGVHATIVSTANATIVRIQDATNSMQFWPSDRTYSSAPGALLALTGTYIYDYPLVSFAALNLQATIQHNQAGFLFNHGLLFNHGNTYRNLLNTAVNYGPLQGFIDQPTIQVNRTTAGTISMSQLRSFLSQPRFNRTTTDGTMAVTIVGQFQAFGTVDTGAVIGTWTRVQLGPFTAGAGTIITYRAIDIDNETQPSTITTGIRLQIASGGLGTRRNIEVTGTAVSTFAGLLHMNNAVALNLGSVGASSVQLLRSAASTMRMIGAGGVFNEGLDWDFDVGTPNVIAVTSSTGAGLGFNLAALAIGTTIADPASNWQFLLAPGAKTVSLAGDFARALFSASANVTINAALSTFTTWTINAPGGTIGAGSVVTAANVLIQTGVGVGTNRYGLLVTSNPAGGTLNYCARFSGAAGVRIDGVLQHTGTTLGVFNTTPAARTAAYSVTNPVDRRSYDTTTITLSQLAEVVGTVIADFILYGHFQ